MKASLQKDTEKDTEEKMHVYEAGFVIMPSLSEETLAEKASSIRGLIEKGAGVIISEDAPKLFPLAYPMDKMTDSGKQVFKEAYFGWVKFEMPSSSISSIEKGISGMPEVLRSLVVKTLRENVLFPEKVGAKSSGDEKTSKEDIDKSIDALVIG